ncbi:MAG: hypothetical protein BGO31_12680 [Bacteroidetes bacterium 43-16]|nr:MAG: hypothetical protein BGO31_12680 [Bacteroidetes bacterium 43-16]
MNTNNSHRKAVHFADPYLLNPTNPITINLIGAGGTGSHVLQGLARMNHVLRSLDHAGFDLRLWDDDKVTEFNIGRQDFSESEIGLYKADVLIHRCNRKYGTDWKTISERCRKTEAITHDQRKEANIYITCVDNVASRLEIDELLKQLRYNYRDETYRPLYWMDFGNSKDTGQVILSTIGEIQQPASELYRPVAYLPTIVEEFGDLLIQSEDVDDTPSCSIAEALGKQDLFINSTLAQMGCGLLFNLIRNAMTYSRGMFVNLDSTSVRPVKF